MNEQEAYQMLAGRLGIKPEMLPYTVELCQDNTIINPLLPETAARLGRIMDLRPGQKILDLACGKAGVTLPLVRTYKVELLGIDLLQEFLREAWSRAEYTGLYDKCDFRHGDVVEFVANTKRQWDGVFILGALTHIWDGLEAGLAAVRPLIAPGGHLVLGEGYLREGASPEDTHKFLTKQETTDRVAELGRIVEILDDGAAGWESYWAPQRKAMTRLREDLAGDNEILNEFLDVWVETMAWEEACLGFAVWVVKVD